MTPQTYSVHNLACLISTSQEILDLSDRFLDLSIGFSDLSIGFSTSQEIFSKISFCWTENSTFLAAGLKIPKNRPCWTEIFIIFPKFSPAGLDFQPSVWKIYQKSSFFQSSKSIFRSRFCDLNFGSKKSHFDGFFDLDFFSILDPKIGNFGT